MKSKDEILKFLVDVVARNINVAPEAISLTESLERYGVDSMQWANIAYELSIGSGRELTAEQVAAGESIAGIAQVLT